MDVRSRVVERLIGAATGARRKERTRNSSRQCEKDRVNSDARATNNYVNESVCRRAGASRPLRAGRGDVRCELVEPTMESDSRRPEEMP